MTAIDKDKRALCVGDHALYVYNNPPVLFSIRGIVSNIVPIGAANDGEQLHLVDVQVEFVDKKLAKPGQTIRVWSGDLMKYDAERTNFV